MPLGVVNTEPMKDIGDTGVNRRNCMESSDKCFNKLEKDVKPIILNSNEKQKIKDEYETKFSLWEREQIGFARAKLKDMLDENLVKQNKELLDTPVNYKVDDNTTIKLRPLDWILMSQYNENSFKIIEILLQNGANINTYYQ